MPCSKLEVSTVQHGTLSGAGYLHQNPLYLAPSGRHVASLFCQHVAPERRDGRSRDETREAAADVMIDTVEAYAPGFKASIIARQIISPVDLEPEFALVGGDIFHGRLSLDQLYSARPVL
jgi:phytoene dehydrogenase-like protein